MRWQRLALVLGLFACSSDSARPQPEPEDVPDASPPTPDVSIQASPETLELNPGGREVIELQCDPPGVYSLSLSVRPSKGNEHVPAFLNESRVVTDANGRAEVVLSVPTASPDFFLEVLTVGGELKVPVKVVQRATAQLAIVPLYEGNREIDAWVVSTRSNEECAETCNLDFESEQLWDPSTPLEDVPASTPIAVLVRGKHYACGCQQVSLVPGVANTVNVIVTDRRLQLAQLDLDLTLGFERTLEFAQRLESTFSQLISDFRTPVQSEFESEAATLVLGMAERSSAPDDLAARAIEEDWKGQLDLYLFQRLNTNSPLSAQLDVWLRQGGDDLLQPSTLSGKLTGDAEGQGQFALRSVVGISPEEAGLSSTVPAQLGAAGDLLQAGIALGWDPAVLLGALADRRVKSSQGVEVAEGLERLIDCTAIGELLSGPSVLGADAGAAPDTEGECGPSCIQELCAETLEAQWARALTPAQEASTLEFALSAVAKLNDWAVPIAFEGRWRGSTEFGQMPGGESPDAGAPQDGGSVPLEPTTGIALEGPFYAAKAEEE